MNLTAPIVAAGCGSTVMRASTWVQPLQAACDRFGINTPLRVAAFLAQCGVESARLTATSENLNYSAAGLLSTFSKYFDAASAEQYANQPQRIANRAYANRFGNGDEASGDGWKFRARSLIGITFRDNYVLCGLGIDLPLLEHPELLEQPAESALAAAWWWSNKKLNALADASQFQQITKAVDGGLNGYSERLALYGAAKKVLGA
ncbi:glycoside hydrolase family 19 protein [Paraburkholderia sp. RL17-383-BIF-A]|uniref:glycoside hydrolase family 19 protein n=1 Tax=Paraburkholderia sp. RL17-383-BIF-A TaxID=3031631 RepID=UPI0038B8F5D8